MDEEEVTPERLIEALEAALAMIDQRFDLMDERVEASEKQFAQMMMGYLELNSAFEALLLSIFGSGDTEEAIKFRTQHERIRSGYLGWFQDAVQREVGGVNQGLNDAILDLVRQDEVVAQPAPSDPGDGEPSTGVAG